MGHLVFWQTVGAVITGNALTGFSIYMIWRVTKEERGEMPRAPLWVYPLGCIAFVVAAFSFAMLPS